MSKCNLSVGLKQSDISCDQQPRLKEKPFTIYHNGADMASVVNQKGEDVTEYFNVSFEYGILKVDFKKAPSFDEWRKIVGKS
jgi:hypothetical protein